MNDEVIDDLYNRAKGLGYGKEREDFLSLLATNTQVFDDNFDYVQKQGYKKDKDAFAELIGVKKKRRPIAHTFRISCGWGGNFCGVTVHIGSRVYRCGISRSA